MLCRAFIAVWLVSALSQRDPEIVFEAPNVKIRQGELQDGNLYHTLLHNGINIGRSYDRPKKEVDRGKPLVDFSRFPTTYYHDRSPVGLVFQKYNWFPGDSNTYRADARFPASMIGMGNDVLSQVVHLFSEPPVAVLGMGNGTMASYARPGQMFHFTERMPQFAKLCCSDKKEERFFHYVHDAVERGAFLTVIEGDPRELLEKHRIEQFYQLIVIETIKVPVSVLNKDLMTKEAIQLLMNQTRSDGVLCFHVTNRNYDLVPILASTARELKFACLHGDDAADWEGLIRPYDRFGNDWVLIARKEAHLSHLKTPDGFKENKVNGENVPFWNTPKNIAAKFVWTDKGPNSFRGVYRRDPTIDEISNRISAFEDQVADGAIKILQNRKTQPFYDALKRWSKSSADAMNRDSDSPKSVKEKK